MNDSTNDEALGSVNKDESYALPSWAYGLVSTVVAALIIASVLASFTVRDTVGAVVLDIEHIKAELLKIDKFHQEPRYAQKDATKELDPLRSKLTDIKLDIDKLESRLEVCRDSVYNIREDIISLPQMLPFPFTVDWQNLIRRNERDIASCGCMGPVRRE